jgi:hypothetical protein
VTELYNNILNHLNNPRWTEWYPDWWGNVVYASGNVTRFSKSEGVPIPLWTHYDGEEDPELDAELEASGSEVFGWVLEWSERQEKHLWFRPYSGSHWISSQQLRGRFPLKSGVAGKVTVPDTKGWECTRCNGRGYYMLHGVPLAGGYHDHERCPRCEGTGRMDGFISVKDRDYAPGVDTKLRKKGIHDMNTIPAFVPVIHPISREAALASVECAVKSGADGIFLINQGMDADSVFDLSAEVKDKYPDLWIGLNILGDFPAVTLKRLGPHINGLWTDNAEIDERLEDQSRAKLFQEAREELDWKGLYYGGVDFKGQRRVPFGELGRAAVLATQYIDVVTTSGPATGEAADIERIKEMRVGLGDHPMALASGVTPKNIHNYLPYVDSFLVASGIEKHFGVLDPVKTAKLAKLIRSKTYPRWFKSGIFLT